MTTATNGTSPIKRRRRTKAAIAELRRIVETCIPRHSDETALERMREVEDAERATLATIIANLDAA